MKKIIFLGIVLLAISSCRKETICIATYNVGVFTKSGENLMNVVSEIMKEAGADAICLNELDSCTARTGGRYQIADFAEMMGGWNFNFTRAIHFDGGSYGIGIVSKPELEVLDKWGLELLKCDGCEQRALSVVEFQKFVLATAHLDHMSDAARLNQAKTVTKVLNERYGTELKPVVFCGDMNAKPDSETLTELKKSWTVISGTDFTFSADNPHTCIDYIMVLNNDAKFSVKSCSVGTSFKSGDVTAASDHLPVITRIVF